MTRERNFLRWRTRIGKGSTGIGPGGRTQTQGQGLDRLSPRGSLTTWVDTSAVADIISSKRVDELLKWVGCTQRSLVLKSVVV